MQNKKIGTPDFSRAWREAGAILASRGNRLILIESVILLLVSVSLYIMLYNVFFTAFAPWVWGEDAVLSVFLQVLYGVAVAALTLFVTLPSVVGGFMLAGEMERGREVMLADLFAPFSSAKRYGRALRLSWGAFWRFGLIVLAVALTLLVGKSLFPEEDPALVGLVCGLLAVIEVIVGLMLCTRRFAVMAVALYGEIPLSHARNAAENMARMCRRGGAVFFFSVVPWALLGLLTVGILLLWDTLPRMLIAYFRYCRQMNDMIIRSEEYTNHE